jgi:3-hydroxyisobutyrate dehydrogenase
MTAKPSPTVAVLGTGTMGAPMARNLLAAGLSVTVWDRTPGRTRPLIDLGASMARTPADAAGAAGVVITMVSTPDAVRSLALEAGVLDGLAEGAVWAQMATIGLAATAELAALSAERRPDVAFVDAPVSGTKGPAEAGKLLILASGPDRAQPPLEPVFAAIGGRTLWLGEAGRGTRLKLVLNAWLAFLMEGVAETAALADRLGVTQAEFTDAIHGGPLAAGVAVAKLAKIAAKDFEPDFALQWALKDVGLALTAATAANDATADAAATAAAAAKANDADANDADADADATAANANADANDAEDADAKDAGKDTLPVLAAVARQWHSAVAAGLGPLDVSAARLAL